MNRATTIAKAAAIKTSVDQVDEAFESGDIEAAKAAFDRLHAKLNGLAARAAEHFGGDVTEFSGGTDKPTDPPAP